MFITVLLFICYMVSFICSCSYYYLCTLFLLHELFPLYTHTHYGRVLTTLDLHVQILDDCSNVQVLDEAIHIARSLGPLLLILVLLHFLFLLLFLVSRISHLACHSIPVISWFYLYCIQLPYSSRHSVLSCVVLYVLLQWPLIIIVLIIACSGYNLGLACIQGVFYLAYMRRHNVSVSIGLGRYKISLRSCASAVQAKL